MMLRVAVVGAGAAGLCAARHILSRLNCFSPPVVFEQSGDIGGTWCYDERVQGPVHSSMYRDLRTNLPKEVMMFPDFPFEPELASFLSHHDVLRYLQSYSERHNLRPHIRFNTLVENVVPVVTTTAGEETKTTWEVTSVDQSGRQKTETFDSVFICSGHYSDPHIPEIPGIHNFKGKVLHSHLYRCAEPFSGQSVVVLGAKASGLDISIELAKVGAKVTLSHGRPRLTFPLPDGISQAAPVTAIDDNGRICFQDGSVGGADVLLFCTGYNFRFQFLDAAQLGLQVNDHLVTPLFHFLFPPTFPSIFFIGLCKIIVPFPHFDCQVQFALSVLEGSVSLPSGSQMLDEVHQQQQELLDQGVEQRHLLLLDHAQWEYCSMLARSAGFPPLPPVTRSLYEEVWRQRRIHPANYRRLNYRLKSESQWELVD